MGVTAWISKTPKRVFLTTLLIQQNSSLSGSLLRTYKCSQLAYLKRLFILVKDEREIIEEQITGNELNQV